MSRDRKQDRINKGDLQGSQKDLFGSEVHILNVKETFRLVKCGRCGNTVKSSQAKTHLSYGKVLTICSDCLKKDKRGIK